MAVHGRKKGSGGALSARQAQLVEILATPEGCKYTQQELADKVGANKKTIQRWLKDDEVNRQIQKKISTYAFKLLPHAWKCLEERMSKDSQALKLYFSLIGEHSDRLELTGKDGGTIKISHLNGLSEEELTQMAKELEEGKG